MSTYEGPPLTMATLTQSRYLTIITYLTRHPHGSTVAEVARGVDERLEVVVGNILGVLERAHMVKNADGVATIDKQGLLEYIMELANPSSDYSAQLQRDPNMREEILKVWRDAII